MSNKLEYPDCPLCGCSQAKVLYEGERFAPYGVRSCLSCGMSFLSPRPTEEAMLSLYQMDQYFSGQDAKGYGDYAAQEPALRATFRRLLQSLDAKGKTGGALLEIGCGFGYLLDEARPYFSRRVGTDFSSEAVRHAQGRAEEVLQGGADALPGTELFDCVIATHVIEHVYNPRHFVRNLLQCLRPGGRLIIAAPDMGSFWRKLMGSRWPSFKVPEHVNYFDANTLARLLTETGVRNVEHVTYPHAFSLPLIASKFGIELPGDLDHYSLWLPATTIAYLGVKGD